MNVKEVSKEPASASHAFAGRLEEEPRKSNSWKPYLSLQKGRRSR